MLGVKPLADKLKKLGGWPVVDQEGWTDDNFSWEEWTYKANTEGLSIDHLLSLTLNPDEKNSSWRVISIDQPILGMDREYLVKGFNDSDVQHYYTYMVDTAVLFGASRENAEKELKLSLQFEIELAHISKSREDRKNITALYNPTTLQAIPCYRELPNARKFARRLFKPFVDFTIDGEEKVILTDPKYLEKLSKLLEKTEKKVLANYLAWRTSEPLLSFLNKEAKEIKLKYEMALFGTQVICQDLVIVVYIID